MRLICGIVRLDGAGAARSSLDAMLEALASPGLRPSAASRVEGAAALGVLDFSRSLASPSLTPGPDGAWLAADVRLDRPAELARTLGLDPNSSSHDDLTRHAVQRWGRDTPNYLHGDFALASWNPHERRLLCARDVMGVRPLCYTHQPGRFFAFASFPRGLHASGIVNPKLDATALGVLLVRGFLSPGETHFAGIHSLRAGDSLTLTADRLEVHRTWNPSPTSVGSHRCSAQEAAETLRTLVEEAVACRLPAEGAVAAHLSGGLDSSTLVAIAARKLRGRGQKLHTYSQLADPSLPPGADERQFVDAVLNQEGDIESERSYIGTLDASEFFDPDLPEPGIIAQSDDWICRQASLAGAQVLLSGLGGDEAATFNGMGIYATMMLELRWRTLPLEIWRRSKLDGLPFYRAVVQRLVTPLFPDVVARLRGHGPIEPVYAGTRNFLNPSLAPAVLERLPGFPGRLSTPNDRIDMLRNRDMVPRSDRWAMFGARHGLAFTYPLLDRRIVDFILSLPVDRFADNGYTRQPFRNAMGGILPESIRWRTTKFVPYPDFPMKLAASADRLLERLHAVRGCAAAGEIVNWDAMEKALQAALPHRDEGYGFSGPSGLLDAPPWALPAHRARKALVLAEYIAHFES